MRNKIRWEDYLESLVVTNQKNKKIQTKKEVLENAQNVFDGRRQFIKTFEENFCPLPPQTKDERYEKYAFDILLGNITEEKEEDINTELI